MRKGLANPNSIQALKELKMEIANEIGIPDLDAIEKNKQNKEHQEINKRLSGRYRNNLIGFK